jgi:transcriptional regulator GlxA family with amidase domain
MSVILWRLLTRRRTAALATNHAHRLVTTIHVLRFPFAESIRIEELASIAAGPSASCRQFKALTPMTPLPVQSQLRLLEARRVARQTLV